MADFQALREKNITLAKKSVRESVNPDLFIVNAVNNIEELERIQNVLSKRLREWYSLYFPELDKRISDNEEFIRHVLADDKQAMIRELNVIDCMGSDLTSEEVGEMKKLASSIQNLYEEEKHLQAYLAIVMKNTCPNIEAITGHVIGAKLLRGAGSLKRLAMMRSSTIQLIGAEKALFRHIKTGARPPKYGYLLQHPLVQKARRENRGKAARALADKIFLAARIDYFKGQFIGDKLLKEVEVKLHEDK